ncbi:MAG: hypothetical protein AWU55_597 [Halomonadaceae bacterium T82-2]|nr:MAG: hypothetical protein AWU55_597 [Halomonadaceae bacterium T82-2]
MSEGDQAAGLRRWAAEMAPAADDGEEGAAPETPAMAEETGTPTWIAETLVELAASASLAAETAPAPRRLLMVLGLPGGDEADTRPVSEALVRWQAQGQRWVGEADDWRIVPTSVDSPHLPALLDEQSRWALWVGNDADAFRRTYRLLKRLAQRGGPRRLLLVHPPLASRAGLLANLQQAAASFFGFELWIVPVRRRRRHGA